MPQTDLLYISPQAGAATVIQGSSDGMKNRSCQEAERAEEVRIRGTNRWLAQDPNRSSSKGKRTTNRSTEAAGGDTWEVSKMGLGLEHLG